MSAAASGLSSSRPELNIQAPNRAQAASGAARCRAGAGSRDALLEDVSVAVGGVAAHDGDRGTGWALAQSVPAASPATNSRTVFR